MKQNVDTLYFDGLCPLCAHEIKLLSKLKKKGLALVDIHSLEESSTDLPSSDEMLRVLHLRTGEGEWKLGVDATVGAWSHTRIGWLWRVLTLPGIRWLADKAYYPWARRRYERRYCSVAPEASK
jgi:predicted DCC family thiol-disulfide oxidoreductase YuxK